jgi:uncharacterized zinc-type alcohol dehydrogenase-like protein
MTIAALGYAAFSPTEPLGPFRFKRRDPLPHDVAIQILNCGVCHSDLHHVRDELRPVIPTRFPFVPGHEIVGRVTAVGSAVTNHEVGDLVGVGCLVDTDGTCDACRAGLEQLCRSPTITIGAPDEHGTEPQTYGGFSNTIVVKDHFVLKVPENLNPAAAAPLLCAGITAWSPLRHHGVGEGDKVGIVGLGGLGHMGVKFAKALGARVVVFTTSPGKTDAARELGADDVVVSKNAEEMQKHSMSCDFILDTVSGPHDVNAYLNLLRRDGNLTLVGISDKPFPVSPLVLLHGRRSLSGSNFGSIAETQEMLDFCGKHSITADVEVIRIQDIDKAFERMSRNDVKYRFSIDMSSLGA